MRTRTKILAGALASAALAFGGVNAATAGEPAAPKSEKAASASSSESSAVAATEPRPTDVRGRFSADGVKIWSKINNGTVLGLGYKGHAVTSHCNVEFSPGQYNFVYATNNTTGVTGYVYSWYVPGADRAC